MASPKPMEICLIGDEDAGKKSLLKVAKDLNIWKDEGDCQMLSDDDTFLGIPVMFRKWTNPNTGEKMLCKIADISEPQNISNVAGYLRSAKSIQAFILFVNSANPVVEQGFCQRLKLLELIFGEGIFQNLIPVFLRWSYDEKSIKIRRCLGVSEEAQWTQLDRFFQKHFNTALRQPGAFLDSFPVDEREEKLTMEQLGKLRDSVIKLMPYTCHDIADLKEELLKAHLTIENHENMQNEMIRRERQMRKENESIKDQLRSELLNSKEQRDVNTKVTNLLEKCSGEFLEHFRSMLHLLNQNSSLTTAVQVTDQSQGTFTYCLQNPELD